MSFLKFLARFNADAQEVEPLAERCTKSVGEVVG